LKLLCSLIRKKKTKKKKKKPNNRPGDKNKQTGPQSESTHVETKSTTQVASAQGSPTKKKRYNKRRGGNSKPQENAG
jgi:hypothetical protein